MDSLVTCDVWLTASSVWGLEPHPLGGVSHPALPRCRHTVLLRPVSALWERMLFVFLKSDENKQTQANAPKER